MPLLVASYPVYDDTASSSTITTPSFAPNDAEIIVVKAVSSSAVQTMGVPTGTGLTFTQRVMDGTASHCRVAIWTAPVVGSLGSISISLSFAIATVPRSMMVERWQFAAIDPSPATVDTRGSGAPSTSLITTADDSVVSWCNGDWNAVDGAARVYNATSGAAQEGSNGYRFDTGDYTVYYAWQTATSATSQTLGLTNPTGQTWTLAGIELLDFGAELQLDPLPLPLYYRAPGRNTPTGRWTPILPLQEGNAPAATTPPTVDRATVAAVNNTTGTSPATTAAFTVPAATGLVALVHYNSPSVTAVNHTVSGAGLTWTLLARKSRDGGSLGGAGTDGGVEIWWAYSSAGFSSQTVTCTWASGTSQHTGLKVLLVTGGQPQVVGAVAVATSSAGQPRVADNQTQDNAVIVGVTSDWSQKGAAVVSPDQAAFDANDVATAYTGWWQWRITPDPVIGPHLIDELTNARQFNTAAVEILGQVVAGGGATNAPAELADSTYVAGDATAAGAVNAGSADLSVAAQDPTLAVAVQAECATWSAAAQDPAVGAGAQAENAAATFAANDATVSTATATNAPAEAVAWAVAAGDPVATVAVQAECATWTLAAQTPSTAVAVNAEAVAWSAAAGDATVSTATATSAPAEAASWTAAAGDPVAAVSVNAECATWTAVAADPTAAVAPQAGVATWTAAGQDPAASAAPQPAEAALTTAGQDPAAVVAASADVAPATFAALDPVVTTGSVVNAPAECASWSLAAQDPASGLAVNAECATWTTAALDPAATLGVPAGVAAWTGAAQDPSGSVGPAGGAAAWTAAAQDASTAVQASADVAPWTGTANDPTVILGGNVAVQAECATWSLATPTTTAGLGPQPGLVAWTMAADAASTAQAAAADLVTWFIAVADGAVPTQFTVGALAATSQSSSGLSPAVAATAVLTSTSANRGGPT